MAEIRVRIAPSPTGRLHIGTARVALFNYLFAKKHGGKFIVRVEDTDSVRSTDEFDKDILNGLEWLGLHWDEGPKVGGEFGPYYQHERLELYSTQLDKLLAAGRAYKCFCTAEELEAEREDQQKKGQAPRYSGGCRNLSPEETEKKGDAKYAVRLKVEPGKIEFNDLVRGQVEFDSEQFGDVVLARSDGSPLFLFTNVVDDDAMKISHVLRGDDHLTNTAKQILIAQALGLTPPQFGHLPMILNADRSKMSKRKDPVSVTADYQAKGYLPEALVNFIALLGWAPGDDKEIFTLEELTKAFDLAQVGKSPSVFDPAKLLWMNGYYLRQLSLAELKSRVDEFVRNDKLRSEIVARPELYDKALELIHERIKTLAEIEELVSLFFEKPDYPAELLIEKKSDRTRSKHALDVATKALESAGDFSTKHCETLLRQSAADNQLKDGELLWAVRVALTGKPASPGAFEMLEALGKEESLERLAKARDLFAAVA